MKQSELKPCALCHKGVMHGNTIICTQIKVQRMLVNIGAVRRQAGLEMMLGSAGIAAVMGPNEDMLQPVHKEEDMLICDDCATSRVIGELWEVDTTPALTPQPEGGKQ